MNRFITLKNEQGCYDMINAHHIITVENMYDGKLQIRMVNGMKYIVDEAEWNNLSGHDSIVQIVPCKGIAVELVVHDTVYQGPVFLVALTASGKLRPVNERLEFMDVVYGDAYRGVVPFEGYIPQRS